jgi:hypothetical protein
MLLTLLFVEKTGSGATVKVIAAVLIAGRRIPP